MESLKFVLLIGLCYLAAAKGHTYHVGSDCAPVEPMPDFDMEKFLGRWYAIQKTSTASRCMVYDFQTTVYRNRYSLEQISVNPLIDLVKNNTYKYTGDLYIPQESNKANMLVKFPLNVAGESSFIVFMTDYTNYAGVYTCQKVGFTHRHSATILSRKPSMDKSYVEKIRNRLSSSQVNPFDLTSVNHTGCKYEDAKLSIDIDHNTFSKDNIVKFLKNVGSKVSEGAQVLAKGAKKVYNDLKNDGEPETKQTNRQGSTRDREEVTEDYRHYFDPNAELL